MARRGLSTDVPAKPAPVSYRPVKRREEMRVGRDGVLAALGNGGATILDGRSTEEYNGTRVGGPGGPDVGAVRYGRIPGARHVYFADLFQPDNSFKPKPELAALFATKNVAGDRDIITYCRMSHRATVLHFALTQLLGHGNVRVYDGSWTEWGNLVGVPIER
jgi:thiosulfate/3-mercaptopyruvate sulfurtransferase